MSDLQDDLHKRWLPSTQQMVLADALLRDGWDEDRDGPQGKERGVYTAHLLLNKEYGWWNEDVTLLFLDGVFVTREAVLSYVHAEARRYFDEHPDVKLTGGWAWHPQETEAAVFEDIMSRFPNEK